MSKETVSNALKKIFEYCGSDSSVNIMFQGGEPLLAGIDFYRHFIDTVNNFVPKNTSVNYSLQTNGTLIDDEFCKLFKENDFLIGLSLDGEKEIHDSQRDNSYDDVIKASQLLRNYDVDFNIVSVITANTDAGKLFNFCKEHGFDYLQTIYCLEPLGGEFTELNPDPKKIASLKKRIFNKWFTEFQKDDQAFSLLDADNILAYLVTGETTPCELCGNCSPQLVIEADGTVYPCDFYCIDDYKCPNINSHSLNEILRSDAVSKFMHFDVPENELCDECGFYDMCEGGCKRYRRLFNQIKGYCPQRDYFDHVIDKLQPYLNGGEYYE